MIAKIKSILKNWGTIVPEIQRGYLAKTLVHTNILRLRIIAWLLIIFNSFLIGIQQIFIDKVNLKHIEYIDLSRALEIAPLITELRLVIIGVSVTFLLIAKPPAGPEAVTRRHEYCESAFLLSNLVVFSVLSGIIQSTGPGISTAYIMAILVVAAFCYLNWQKALFIYSIAWCVMSIMMWRFQIDWLIAASGFLNCSVMTVIALVISQIIYNSRVREVLNQQLLELQKENLTRSNEILQSLSYLDDLTKIPNRRDFNSYINREWKRSSRERKLLSLIMIDIDCFKKYNDTYGHQAGDDALARVATTLSDVIKRPADRIARYGGEEFVVILPDTNLAGARKIAGLMNEAVEALNIRHKHSPTGKVTISLGVACMLPKLGLLPDILISNADKALYKAKKAGGNQYFVMDE